MLNKIRSRRESGDTIIEVLIAVAVVSSVLAITYSIMNENILILRNNQERTEASKIAQSHLERLKKAWQTADPASFPGIGNNHTFCMSTAGETDGFSGGAPHADINSDNFANYPAGCVESFYHTAITYDNGLESYLVRVRWDSISHGRSEVIMGYKLQ